MPPADVTIYRDPSQVNIVVVDGAPPSDQSALVAQLQGQVTQLTNDLSTANGKVDAYKTFAQGVAARAQARKEADDAKVDGQDDLDAAANLPA